MKDLLRLRKEIKAKKPKFKTQDSHKRIEVPERWRKPKGRHSKMKAGFAGHRAMPCPGFGSPKAVRGMHKSGLMPVIIGSISELPAIDRKTQGAVLRATVGKRKTADLLNKAKELGISILNVRDSDARIKQIQEELEARREARKKRGEEKEAKTAKKKEEQAKQKEKEEKEKKTEKEKKETEKKELDKALITRVQ